MAETAPGITDVKRLFALSRNRCAFPKCSTPVFLEGSLVAEVCHIKGENLGSARYDETQTPQDRHSYENLIVMCRVHHKVIDDDEDSYTVDRLRKLKVDHESGATPLPDAQVSQIAQLYIATLNINHGVDPAKSARMIRAVDTIWNATVNLQREFSDVVFFDTIFTRQELQRFFAGRQDHPAFQTIELYRDQMIIMRKVQSAGTEDVPRERPFVSPRLYGLYSAAYGVLARSAMLLCLSFQKRQFHSWRDDELIDQHIKSVLPATVIHALQERQTYALHGIIEELLRQFVAEAERIRH